MVTSWLRPSSKSGFRSSSRTSSDEKNCSNWTAHAPGRPDRARLAPDGRRQELDDLGFQRADAPFLGADHQAAAAVQHARHLVLESKDRRHDDGADVLKAGLRLPGFQVLVERAPLAATVSSRVRLKVMSSELS